MGEQANGGEQSPVHRDVTEKQVFAAVSHERRWTVLSVLDREGPMDLEALARAVVTEATGPVGAEAAADTVERAALELVHLHLPKLEAAGLVSRTDDTVRACLDEHDTVPDVRAFVETNRRSAARRLQVLCTAPRRTVCTVLSETGEPMGLGAVATAVRQRSGAAESTYTHDALRVALHHVHLPVLDQVGLVRYDHTAHVAEFASTRTVFDEAT